METVLKGLFDYQRFEGNRALQCLIDAVHSRFGGRELNLSEMSLAAAAGVPDRTKDQDTLKKIF